MTDEQRQQSRGRRDVDEFESCPRFDKHELTDDQVEDIATRAAVKAVEIVKGDFYREVGRGVVGRFFWLLGYGVAAIVGTMFATGHLKFPWSN